MGLRGGGMEGLDVNLVDLVKEFERFEVYERDESVPNVDIEWKM